jgi:hypothetical protein
MRLEVIPQWGTLDKTASDRQRELEAGREFVGIAIAPGSEESVIDVEGVGRLQSGRILPLRDKSYSIRRVRPRSAAIPINRLELMLFEHEAEMGEAPARANQTYTYATTLVHGAATDKTFVVPFAGRQKAQFTLWTSSATPPNFVYYVVGLRWQYSLGLIVPVLLKTEVNPPFVSIGGGAGGPGGLSLPASKTTYSFYVGGTDNAENWDALWFLMNNTDGAADYIVGIDAEVSGDSGRD